MEFGNIGGYSGVLTKSENGLYQVIRSRIIGSDNTHIVLGGKAGEVMFVYQVGYCDTVIVSNNGHVAAYENNVPFGDDPNLLYGFGSSGRVLFKKQTFSNMSAMSYDLKGEYLAIGFAGKDDFLESYSILFLDASDGILCGAKKIPESRSLYKMWFDSDNKLKVELS